MLTDNVPIMETEIVEELICAAANQALRNNDEISPLAVTPRGTPNRTPPSQPLLQQQVSTRNSLFGAGAIDESINR